MALIMICIARLQALIGELAVRGFSRNKWGASCNACNDAYWVGKKYDKKIVFLPSECYEELIDSDPFKRGFLDQQLITSDTNLIFLPIKVVGEPWRIMVTFHPNVMSNFRKTTVNENSYTNFTKLGSGNDNELMSAHIVFELRNSEFSSKNLIQKMNQFLDCQFEDQKFLEYKDDGCKKDKRYGALMFNGSSVLGKCMFTVHFS